MSRTARRVRLIAAPTVTVGGASYQKIDGFGISESFNTANAIRG